MKPIDGSNKPILTSSTRKNLQQRSSSADSVSLGNNEKSDGDTGIAIDFRPVQLFSSTFSQSSTSIAIAKDFIESCYSFELPTSPQSNNQSKSEKEALDPNFEKLKKQFTDTANPLPFEFNPLQKPNYDIAWLRNRDSSFSIVIPEDNGNYKEVFRSVSDSQSRQPYYGYSGVFENRFVKEGEYIDFLYPLKHNQGIPELTQDGKFQTSENFSIVRVGLAEPHETRVVASIPGSDINSALRDPESQEILAVSSLSEDLTVGWQANNDLVNSKIAALLKELRKSRGLSEDKELSIQDIKISRKDGDETWTVFSSSATKALMKHQFRLNDNQFHLLSSESESNFRTNNTSQVLKLEGSEADLSALMISPNGKDPKRLPTLVMAHGGPYRSFRNISDEDTKTANFFAEQGFNVLMINHSGSTDSGLNLVNAISGNQEIAAYDLIAATKDAIKRGLIDASNGISLFGHSFGGYTVAKAAEIDSRSNEKGLYDSTIASSPVIDFQADAEYLKKRNQPDAAVQVMSDFAQIDGAVKPSKFKTPILFFVGHQNDGDCGTLDKVREFTGFLPPSTHYHLVGFEGEGHTASHKNEMTVRYARSLDFLQDPNSLNRGTELIKESYRQNPLSKSQTSFLLSE